MAAIPEFGIVPEPESDYSPALTANTKVYRNFKRDLSPSKYPWRTALYVDNTRGSGVVTLYIYGGNGTYQRKVGVGGTLDFTGVGPLTGYSLESTSNESADVVKVFENGGLNVPE